MRFGVNISIPFFVENTELHIGPRPKIVFIVAGKHGKILKKRKFKPIIPKTLVRLDW
jgi:hypothetical protein